MVYGNVKDIIFRVVRKTRGLPDLPVGGWTCKIMVTTTPRTFNNLGLIQAHNTHIYMGMRNGHQVDKR